MSARRLLGLGCRLGRACLELLVACIELLAVAVRELEPLLCRELLGELSERVAKLRQLLLRHLRRIRRISERLLRLSLLGERLLAQLGARLREVPDELHALYFRPHPRLLHRVLLEI